MKLSVAIVTRNRSQMLRRCLNSLSTQRRKPDQIIIVDNGSKDQTKDMVLSFKRLPIKYLFEGKIGVAYARNKALQSCNGEILAFIDDDCEAGMEWTQNIEQACRKYPAAIAIQGWSESFPKQNIISIIASFNYELSFKDKIKKRFPSFLSYLNGVDFLNRDYRFPFTDTKNVAFKLDEIKKKGIKFNTSIPVGYDYDFARQIISKDGLIMFCPKIKVRHWERPTIWNFIRQSFSHGRGVGTVRSYWLGKENSKRPYSFWLSRSIGFILYCLNKGVGYKLLIIFPLYVLERFAYGFGILSIMLRKA